MLFSDDFTSEQSLLCSECGHTNIKTWKYCIYCKSELNSKSELTDVAKNFIKKVEDIRGTGSSEILVGIFDSGMQNMNNVLEMDPANYETISKKAFYQMELVKDIPGALQTIEYGLEYYPDDFWLLENKSDLQLELGQPEQSLETINFLIEKHPDMFEYKLSRILASKSVILTKLSRPHEAIESVSKAIELGYDIANGYYVIAMNYIRTKNYQDAMTYLKKVLEEDPKHFEAKQQLELLEKKIKKLNKKWRLF